jgi:hypothetical protein
MAYVRLTLLKPRPGSEDEVMSLLQELDAQLAEVPGLVFSFLMSREDRLLGRASVWLSKDEANREALSDRVLSLRSRLRYLSLSTEESLLYLRSGHFPSGFSPAAEEIKYVSAFATPAQQPSLPAK